MENIQNTEIAILNEGEVNNMTNELKLVKPMSKDASRGERSSAGAMIIVNSKKNGKRITISKNAMNYIGNPTILEVAFVEEGIVISEKLVENAERFSLRKSGNKAVIYSCQLVNEITEMFSLDFDRTVSKTFTDVEYIQMEHPIVKINIESNLL